VNIKCTFFNAGQLENYKPIEIYLPFASGLGNCHG
jgi:hypothetical protein